MDMKCIKLWLMRLPHYIGIHNKKCRRRVFTTKNKYVCMVTGKIHKKFKL